MPRSSAKRLLAAGVVVIGLAGCTKTRARPLPSRPFSIAVDTTGQVFLAADAGVFKLEESTPEFAWSRDGVLSPALAVGSDGPFVVFTAGEASSGSTQPDSIGLFLQIGDAEPEVLAPPQRAYAASQPMHPGETALVPVDDGFIIAALVPSATVLRPSLSLWRLDETGHPRSNDPVVLAAADETHGVAGVDVATHEAGALIVYRTSVGGRDAGVSSVVLGPDLSVVAGPTVIFDQPWSQASVSARPLDGRHLLCGTEMLGQTSCVRLDEKGAPMGDPAALVEDGSNGQEVQGKTCMYSRPAIATHDGGWLVAHCITEGSVSAAFGISNLSSHVRLTPVDGDGAPGETTSVAGDGGGVGDLVAATTGEKTVFAWVDGDAGRWIALSP